MGDPEKPVEKKGFKDESYELPEWAAQAAAAGGFIPSLFWFPVFVLIDFFLFDPKKSPRFQAEDAPFCNWISFGPIPAGKRARIRVEGNEQADANGKKSYGGSCP